MSFRKLFIFLIFAAALVLLSMNPLSGSTGFTIEYELKRMARSQHLVHIKAHFNNFPNESARLSLHSYYGGDQMLELKNVTARSSDGRSLDTARDERCYVVSNASNRDFTVDYDLAMNQKNIGYMGYLCESYLLSNSGWTFIVPEGVTALEYRVVFKLPSQWSAVTPWQLNGNYYTEKDFRLFIEATYGCGDFEILERNIGGTQVKIAMDRHFDREFIDRVSKDCFQIFGYIKSLFGAAGPESHLSVLVKATEAMPAQWQYLNENGLSLGEAVDSRYWTYYQYGHRIFHTFNSFYPIGMNITPLWFMEGTDEYYGVLALLDIHFEPPLGRLAQKYRAVYKREHAQYDEPISGSERLPGEFDKEQYLFYHKGALVSYLLDRKIAEATKGQKSLKDVLRALYGEYGHFKNGSITNEVIAKKVQEISGKDFSDFFRDYLYHSKNLDLDDLFNDSDGDGICNAGEDILQTDRNNKDTDRDGAVDGIEYRYATDPLNPRSKTDLPLYIDGFCYDWSTVKYQKISDVPGKNLSILGEVDYTQINNCYYILLRTRKPAIKDSTLRYYANIDIDADKVAEVQVTAVYGSYGDTSRFRKNWSNYGMKPLEDVKGPESAVSTDIEFKIPAALLENKNCVNFTFGIWDTKSRSPIENTHWLKMTFEGSRRD